MADVRVSRSYDLKVRTLTAVVMLAVAGSALWLGGIWWIVFVLLIASGVSYEWNALAKKFAEPGGKLVLWRIGGALYCAISAVVLLTLRDLPLGVFYVLLVVGGVIGTDIGAYMLGRLIGGPKIAPSISPSKTWAGLVGGMAGASTVIGALLSQIENPSFVTSIGGGSVAFHDTYHIVAPPIGALAIVIVAGMLLAVVAHVGDFFESSMKRRAGVKDSGKLLPGHGGLFDRLDGLLSVLFVMGIVLLILRLTEIV